MAYGDGNYGDWYFGGNSRPERLSGPLVLTDTAATQFTGYSFGSKIITIAVSNPSASPVDFTMSLGTDAAGTRVYDGYQIGADTEWNQVVYLIVNPDEAVQAFASTPGVLVLTIDGVVL